MNLTVDSSCSYISATTPSSTELEQWYNGNLSDVQVTIFYNCTQVSQLTLPNQYNFGSSQGSCSVVIGGAEFDINITGILDSQITSTTVTSTSPNIVSVTPVDNVTFTVLMNSSFANFVEFEIIDTNGHTFTLRVDFGTQVIDECDFTDTLTILSTEPLPCGLEFDNVTFTLDIYAEHLRADCNFPCDPDCRSFCDGVYTVQINEDLSCIYVDCNTECDVVDYYINNEGDIMMLLEALKIGSSQTSIGRTDCTTCEQLCEVFSKIQKLLNKNNKITNIIDDCGCNNN